MKRFLFLIFAVAIVFSFGGTTAYANSAPRFWYGTFASAAMPFNTCPIEVESEVLTLSLESADNGLLPTATAEYVFFNPTSADCRVNMVFPFINPELGEEIDKSEFFADFSVTADGQAVEKRMRYTLNSGGRREFDVKKDIELLTDEKRSDEFFCADTTVSGYKIYAEPETYLEVRLKGDNLRFIAEWGESFYNEKTGVVGVNANIDDFSGLMYWTVGEDCRPEITAIKNGKKVVCRYEKISETTFAQFALAYRDENVGEIDWFNAVVDNLKYIIDECGIGYEYCTRLSDIDLLGWFEYDVEIPAGEKLTNVICAPLQPSVDYGFDPQINTVTYLLSPASAWAKFGRLTVNVETSLYLLDSEYVKTDFGYTRTFDGLPAGELVIPYSASPKPERTISPWEIFAYIFVALIIIVLSAPVIVIAAIFIGKAVKSKKKN